MNNSTKHVLAGYSTAAIATAAALLGYSYDGKSDTAGRTFAAEGGSVNNKLDPGGATNMGITEAVARSHGYTGAMTDLTRNTAFEIYFVDYIHKPNYFPMIAEAPAVARKMTDAGINAGVSRSSKWFQTSLNMLNRNQRDYPNIVVDGQVGGGTYAAWNQLKKKRGSVKACEMVLKLMDAQQAAHYMSLYNAKPYQFGEFIVGWIDHRIGNVPLSECKT